MIFGYSTNAYVKYSVKESLERIAALGFNGVEIMCDRPHLYPPDFDAAALADLKRHTALRQFHTAAFAPRVTKGCRHVVDCGGRRRHVH